MLACGVEWVHCLKHGAQPTLHKIILGLTAYFCSPCSQAGFGNIFSAFSCLIWHFLSVLPFISLPQLVSPRSLLFLLYITFFCFFLTVQSSFCPLSVLVPCCLLCYPSSFPAHFRTPPVCQQCLSSRVFTAPISPQDANLPQSTQQCSPVTGYGMTTHTHTLTHKFQLLLLAFVKAWHWLVNGCCSHHALKCEGIPNWDWNPLVCVCSLKTLVHLPTTCFVITFLTSASKIHFRK